MHTPYQSHCGRGRIRTRNCSLSCPLQDPVVHFFYVVVDLIISGLNLYNSVTFCRTLLTIIYHGLEHCWKKMLPVQNYNFLIIFWWELRLMNLNWHFREGLWELHHLNEYLTTYQKPTFLQDLSWILFLTKLRVKNQPFSQYLSWILFLS